MEITKDLLLANGWDYAKNSTHSFVKDLQHSGVYLVIVNNRVYLQFRASMFLLPNITSMEALSQLEHYLSPYRVVDSAPMDAAIYARFSGQIAGG